MELFELTAARAADLIRGRELSPVDLVEALLRRIDTLDPAIMAWETLDPEGAMAAARRSEQSAGNGGTGPLHGVPVAAKDIFYTAGLRTTSGSPMWQQFVPEHDATAVARLRQSGAIILGKTVTTPFAYRDLPRTRNPWNLARTPGGSSSGSGAAVAARMVPAGLGSQTAGSTLRPASFCGVVGLKPTYGRISRYGVTPASWSLDHVGAIARTVEDAALLLQAMAGHDPRDPATSRVALADWRGAAAKKDRAPRLGLVPDYPGLSQPEVAANLKEVAACFERAGAEVREVRLPMPLPDLLAIRNVIGQVEAAAPNAHLLREHPEGYPPRMRVHVEVGQLIPGVAYLHAQRLRRQMRPRIEGMLRGVDCLLLPTVSEVAPEPGSTGDASFQAVWTLFGLPSISLPSGLNSERLPMGTQLVTASFREDKLLSAAAWCEAVLEPLPSPC